MPRLAYLIVVFFTGSVFVATRATAQVLSETEFAAVGGANALSTPAARHLVWMGSDPAAAAGWLLALQQDEDARTPGLNFFRSDDGGASWSFLAPLAPCAAERQTADLVRVGDSIALVRSYDGPSIRPDTKLDPGRKVYF